MTKKTSESETKSAIRQSTAWLRFAQRLADVLENLGEEQYLILSTARSSRFVQFFAQGASGLRVETTSNSYLPEPEQLGPTQTSALLATGWNAPTGSPSESTREADPDGSPNFFLQFSRPVPFKIIANLAVDTFVDHMAVTQPGYLRYDAFDAQGEAFALPGLGLRTRLMTKDDQVRALLKRPISQDRLGDWTALTRTNDDNDFEPPLDVELAARLLVRWVLTTSRSQEALRWLLPDTEPDMSSIREGDSSECLRRIIKAVRARKAQAKRATKSGGQISRMWASSNAKRLAALEVLVVEDAKAHGVMLQ